MYATACVCVVCFLFPSGAWRGWGSNKEPFSKFPTRPWLTPFPQATHISNAIMHQQNCNVVNTSWHKETYLLLLIFQQYEHLMPMAENLISTCS